MFLNVHSVAIRIPDAVQPAAVAVENAALLLVVVNKRLLVCAVSIFTRKRPLRKLYYANNSRSASDRCSASAALRLKMTTSHRATTRRACHCTSNGVYSKSTVPVSSSRVHLPSIGCHSALWHILKLPPCLQL